MILDKTIFAPSTYAQIDAVKIVHERAFGASFEPNLVEALLLSDIPTLDMAAFIDTQIVGHALLTALEGQDRALALAPLAVDPDWRDFLIGTEIVRRLIDDAKAQGWKSIFVLGDPVYYGRFGFNSQLADRVQCAFQCREFQALELEEGALANATGELLYPTQFAAVG
ncbi:GNAT family N-acetyltransferase [Ahrensia sp. 13_GOM-1096m]|uniref:GNAT family N-acetyltransferase n=1 Tax=Ahrensia sp. 13_GOM-1096m TaxID=1380380 RepID=UPI000687E0DD|nr:N-acetyltransferase [Ahrensia sp. 13_GOM-1096m]